ncbi:hypothetical protein pmac_cds_647 [Pandoravirus macleodensis]|uniref:Uncharacterized protein n=1 Tax=Pandoravirus macleodensis TaxID=2107707 RepID=A0A2U7UG21_9VIRU|nr:hypothetical protein pmac_cds_647 [Pandoravirus macleodensis]AVK77335.1 hypothetical protein pmac_cds_647 [Pandoravirus macleodensis]
MSARDQYVDRRDRIAESAYELAATHSGREEQPAPFGAQEVQREAPGHVSRNDGTTAPPIDEDTLMEDAIGDSVPGTSSDALTQFRQRVTLWRLSDCTTLGEQLGQEDPFPSCP